MISGVHSVSSILIIVPGETQDVMPHNVPKPLPVPATDKAEKCAVVVLQRPVAIAQEAKPVEVKAEEKREEKKEEASAPVVASQPVRAVAEACFRAPIQLVQVMPTGAAVVPAPVEDRSAHFVVTSEPSGDLPIGNWSVRLKHSDETGTDWNSLPFPEELKKDVKELEKLYSKGSLDDAELTRRGELEVKIQLKTS